MAKTFNFCTRMKAFCISCRGISSGASYLSCTARKDGLRVPFLILGTVMGMSGLCILLFLCPLASPAPTAFLFSRGVVIMPDRPDLLEPPSPFALRDSVEPRDQSPAPWESSLPELVSGCGIPRGKMVLSPTMSVRESPKDFLYSRSLPSCRELTFSLLTDMGFPALSKTLPRSPSVLAPPPPPAGAHCQSLASCDVRERAFGLPPPSTSCALRSVALAERVGHGRARDNGRSRGRPAVTEAAGSIVSFLVLAADDAPLPSLALGIWSDSSDAGDVGEVVAALSPCCDLEEFGSGFEDDDTSLI